VASKKVFSGTYFCRYSHATSNCLVTGDCLACKFVKRTYDVYDSAVKELDKGGLKSFEGIKRISVLHELLYFHVCSPSMPPCIAHNVMEGTI
jgi:hypothetical protein